MFGLYLVLCVNWLDLHWDFGFSSLRDENWKSFLRFHFRPDGQLEAAPADPPTDRTHSQPTTREASPPLATTRQH